MTLMTCHVGVSSEVTVMMSESRQQNTEVRLAVGHIGDKLDRLTEKVSYQFVPQRALQLLKMSEIQGRMLRVLGEFLWCNF